MLTQTAKRITVAGFAGSLLAIAPVALPAADAAPATGCRQYAVSSTTTTSLSLSPGPYSVGQGFTATATVTVDATGTAPSSGTVTFRYGSSSKTVAVSGGTASADFTAKKGRTQISATFSGECLANSVANGTSSDRKAVVAGVEASRGDSTGSGATGTGNNGGDSGIAGVSASTGGGKVAGLAATGADSQTELFGVLGLGLVTVGGLTLLVRRRRVQG